jgi:hypothetical protein
MSDPKNRARRILFGSGGPIAPLCASAATLIGGADLSSHAQLYQSPPAPFPFSVFASTFALPFYGKNAVLVSPTK